MRINPEECLALCIDHQERLMPVIDEGEELIERSGILIDGLKILEVPMIITRQYPKGLGDTVEEIRSRTEGFAVYDKTDFSCYDDDDIREAIDDYNKDYVILMGAEAHVCVLQTLIDLQDDGYQSILVADCVSSRKEHDKKIAMRRAEYEGAIITSYEALLFELTRDSGHPNFKEISSLVK